MTSAPPTAAAEDVRLIEGTERWFIMRGLPHFIEDYRATEDVFTRTLPVLTLIFFASILGALRPGLGWQAWLGGALLALGVLLGAWMLVNWLKRRRLLARPARVGWGELVVFVLAPPLAVLAGRHEPVAALVVLGLTAGSLALIYLITSYGVLPMTRWAFGRTFRQLGDVYRLVTRAMPLLLLFSTFLFINTEVWQVASALSREVLWGTVTFFVVIAIVFLLARLPEELRRVNSEVTNEFVLRSCRNTPLEEAADELSAVSADGPGPVPLSRRQWANLLLVLLFSQAVQVVLLSLAIWAFFVAFGKVAISESVIEAWIGKAPTTGRLFGLSIPGVYNELLQVAIFLAAFSGLYFTVYAVTDATYREQFFTEIVDDLEASIGVRSAYLALRERMCAAEATSAK
jgi:hypothetical protein